MLETVKDLRDHLNKLIEKGQGDHDIRVHERTSVYDSPIRGVYKSNKSYDIKNDTKIVVITC